MRAYYASPETRAPVLPPEFEPEAEQEEGGKHRLVAPSESYTGGDQARAAA